MSENCNENVAADTIPVVAADTTPVILKSPLENMLTDDSLSTVKDRQKMLMAACYGVVDNFSVFNDPFKHQKRTFFPSQKILKDEIMRRKPGTKQKVIRCKKLDELVVLLKSPENAITCPLEISYIKTEEMKLRLSLEDKHKELLALAALAKGPKISYVDRLRFIEAMMSDEVKVLYRSSQDSLTRSGLDSRNSIMRVIDFYDKVTEVFNNKDFLPESQALPDLHSNFYNLNHYRSVNT